MVDVEFGGVGRVFGSGGVAFAENVEFEDEGVAVGGFVVDCARREGGEKERELDGRGCGERGEEVLVRISMRCGGTLRGIMPNRCAKTSSTMTPVLFHT